MTALIASLTVPLLLAGIGLYAAGKKVDIYAALVSGAGEGLKVLLRIVPALIAILTGVYMLRASGALEIFTSLLEPALSLLGIPPECAPLILIRPLSGSGALGVAGEIITRCGPDSAAGRTAAVMLGSTETTFYTVAVYFGASRVSGTGYAIPAALAADLTGFVVAALTVRLFFSAVA